MHFTVTSSAFRCVICSHLPAPAAILMLSDSKSRWVLMCCMAKQPPCVLGPLPGRGSEAGSVMSLSSLWLGEQQEACVAVAHNRKICSSGRQKNIYTQAATCLKKKAKSHFPQISTDVYKVFQILLPRIKRCSPVVSASHFLSDPFHSQVWELGTMLTSQPSSKAECEPIILSFTRWGQTNFPLRLLPDLSKAFRTKSQPDTKPFRSVPYAIQPRYLLPLAVPLVHPLAM